MSDVYRERIRLARKQLRADYRAYRAEVKKQRLLRKQAKLQLTLEKAGVNGRKQIPVVVHERAQKVKVRHG